MNTSVKVFYHDEEDYNTRAAEIIIPIVVELVEPRSVLDVGCGIGTWLKVFRDHGMNDYCGIESHFIDKSKMQVPPDKYLLHDLNTPVFLNTQYDLVISLEVAEHLKDSAADIFIETLVKHGKTILFSAAIPGQGGENHINEQWPEYWQKKFMQHDYYYYDIIRPNIWRNGKIDLWYRQNIFLVKHKSLCESSPVYNGENLIHPEFWSYKVNSEYYLNNEIDYLKNELSHWENGRKSLNNYVKALKIKVKKKLLKL